jgi:hypothetical protein
VKKLVLVACEACGKQLEVMPSAVGQSWHFVCPKRSRGERTPIYRKVDE